MMASAHGDIPWGHQPMEVAPVMAPMMPPTLGDVPIEATNPWGRPLGTSTHGGGPSDGPIEATNLWGHPLGTSTHRGDPNDDTDPWR